MREAAAWEMPRSIAAPVKGPRVRDGHPAAQLAQLHIHTLAMLGGALSNQLGAATGALAFPVIGPLGVVAVRQ